MITVDILHRVFVPFSLLRKANKLITMYVLGEKNVYTWGEVTSRNLWPRYDRHFVGITWHNVWS